MYFWVPQMSWCCTVSLLDRFCLLSLVTNPCIFLPKIQCAYLVHFIKKKKNFISLSFINHKFTAGKNISLSYAGDTELEIVRVLGCQALVAQLLRCESSCNYHDIYEHVLWHLKRALKIKENKCQWDGFGFIWILFRFSIIIASFGKSF